MAGKEIETMIHHLSRLPGLGPKSAGRVALRLLSQKETLLYPLAASLKEAGDKLQECRICGHIDVTNPCDICEDPKRDRTMLCIVESTGDLWALERTGSYKGLYHILGGVLSPANGVRPEDLKIKELEARLSDSRDLKEIILALSATIDGQTTSFYITELLSHYPNLSHLKITALAHGVPVGGELDYLDEGTLMTALKARRDF